MRYRRYRKARCYWNSHSDSRLNRYFRPIIEDIKKYFFELDYDELDILLDNYGDNYGIQAKSYARETFSSWKNGYVKMSDQTLMRLVETLPWVLNDQKRFTLMEKLVSYYAENQSKGNISIYPTWENYHEKLSGLSLEIAGKVNRSPKINLDPEILNLASWLSKNDMVTAKKVLDNYYIEKYRLMAFSAMADIRRFTALCDALKTRNCIYDDQCLEIELPAERIYVNIHGATKSIFKMIGDFFR